MEPPRLTMPVTRSAVLTGHAVSSFAQTFGSLLLVLLVALLINLNVIQVWLADDYRSRSGNTREH